MRTSLSLDSHLPRREGASRAGFQVALEADGALLVSQYVAATRRHGRYRAVCARVHGSQQCGSVCDR